MLQWLRENTYASLMLLVLRLYVGYEWVTAGWHKITGGFDASGFLTKAVSAPVKEKTGELVYPTFTAFVDGFALPNVGIFNFLVPWGEFLIGLGLILGTLTTAAMFFGLLMNFMFMFSGTVSSNPWLILLGTVILVAGFNAGRFGGDRWVIPYIRKYTSKWFKKTDHLSA